MQQGRGMDEFYDTAELMVFGSGIAAEASR